MAQICDDLRLTSSSYGETSNWTTNVQNEFGEDNSVADWTSLQALADIGEWINCMSLIEDDQFMLTVNGSAIWSDNRHYFVQYSSDGQPEGFLAHDQIGNVLFLGSWYGMQMRILSLDNPVIGQVDAAPGTDLPVSSIVAPGVHDVMLLLYAYQPEGQGYLTQCSYHWEVYQGSTLVLQDSSGFFGPGNQLCCGDGYVVADIAVEVLPGSYTTIKSWVRDQNGIGGDSGPWNDTLHTHLFALPPEDGHAAAFTTVGYTRLEVPASAEIELTDEFTFEAWFKPLPSDSTRFTILCKEGEFQIGRNDGWLMFAVNNSSDEWLWRSSNFQAAPGQWNHVALTYDHGLTKLYVNGFERGRHLYTGDLIDEVPAFNELWIGGRENNPLRSFEGSIDEVRWWNVARTPEQIRTWLVHRNGIENEQGLLAIWSMGEETGAASTYEPISGLTAYAMNGAQLGVPGAPIEDGALTPLDIALSAVTGISTDTILPEGEVIPDLTVRNAGSASVNAFTLHWSYDGSDGFLEWTGALEPGGETMVGIGTFPLATGVVHSLTAWVELAGDAATWNDTLSVGPFFAMPDTPHYGVAFDEWAGSRLIVPDDPSLDLSSDFTIEFWVKPSTDGNFCLYQKGRCMFGQEGFNLSVINGHLAYSWILQGATSCDGVSDVRTIEPVLRSDAWQHIAIVHRENGVDMYRNGVLLPTTLVSGSYGPVKVNDQPLLLGAYVASGGNIGEFFSGELDEFRVWSTFRSAVEIQAGSLVTDGLLGQDELISVWHFGEGEGAVAFDPKGGNNGSLESGAAFALSGSPIADPVVENDLWLETITAPQGNGCGLSSIEPVSITVKNNGAIEAEGFSISYQLNGATYTDILDTNLAPGSTAQYTFAQTIDLTNPGIHSLRCWVTLTGDENPANDTLTTTITSHPPVIVSLEDDFASCAGDSVTLHAAGGTTYVWNTGATSPNITIAPSASSTYTVTVTVTTGCSATDSVHVTVHELPDEPVVDASGTTLCPSDTIHLSTTAGNVLWSIGSTASSIAVTQAGDYHVMHVDSITGCGHSSEIITIAASPLLAIEALGPTAVCAGDPLTLVAHNAGSITWSFTASTADTVAYQNATQGADTLLLTGTSTGGCTAGAQLVLQVVSNDPLASVVDMLPSDGAEHVSLNPVLSFQPVSNAMDYVVRIWREGMDTLAIPTTATNNPVSLEPLAWYQWSVEARNSCQTSISTVRSFRTKGEIDLVLDTLIAPATATAGTMIPVTYSVGNHGTGGTGYQNWKDRVYLSTDNDLRIGDDLLLLEVPNLTFLDSAQTYMRTVHVTIPQSLSGTWYLYMITDNQDAVCWNPQTCAEGPYGSHDFGLSETNENNNFRHTLLSIHIPPAPDLICTSVGSATNLNSNALISVVYGLTNTGELPVLDKTIRNVLYLSSDSTYLDPVTVVPGISVSFSGGGGFSTPQITGLWHDHHIDLLEPGDTVYVPVMIPPASTLDGEYYMFVWLDRLDSVFEAAGEFNNARVRNGTVTVLPFLCELEGELAGPTGQYPNDTLLVIPYTYFNNLDESPPGNVFTNKLYLSEDALFDPVEDQLIAVQQRNDGLQMDTTAYIGNGSFSWQVPANVLGPRTLFAWFDANDNFPETVNSNNIKQRSLDFQLRVNAPLSVTSVTPSASAPLSGQSIDLVVALRNDGPSELDRTVALDIYRSGNEVLDIGTATLVTTLEQVAGSIPAGSTVQVVVPVTVPDGFSGTLYYHAFIDRANVLYELDETDNRAHATLNVGLNDYPDLVVRGVTVPDTVSPANGLSISYWVRNDGSGNASAADRTDRYILSVDAILGGNDDRDLGALPHNAVIAAGDSVLVTVGIGMPFSFNPVGQYHLFVIADAGNAIYEHDGQQPAEGNNASEPAGLYVVPAWTDVAITAFVISADTVDSGTALTATITVRNQGPHTASNTFRLDRVRLSADSTLAGPSFNFPEMAGPLLPGAEYTRQATITVPNGYEGDYVLVAVTDVLGACVNDSVPENNLAYRPLHVDLTPPCDLQVTDIGIQPAGTLYSGQCISVSYTVRNMLGGNAPAAWRDKLFINSAPTLIGAQALAQHQHTGGLPGLGEYSEVFNVCLPTAMSGSRYLIVAADVYNNQYEHQAEANNDTIVPVFLNIPLPTDLTVELVEGPVEWLLGETSTVTLRVRNIGANTAVGLLGNNVHFSGDPLLNTLTDPLFATIQQPVHIAPGGMQEFQITKRLEDIDPGLYHYLAQTNTQANLNETNFLNNTGASVELVNVDATEIPLGGSANTTLNNGDLRYYKVHVPTPGLDLLVTLDSDQEFGHNQVYHAHGRVPSLADHDHVHEFANATDQQVLIPSADTGWHYLLTTTSIHYAVDQNAILSVAGLPLSIIEIRPSLVGQGPVTLSLIGARFSEGSTFQLMDLDGDVVQNGAIISFVNSMRVMVFFDLTSVAIGDYRIRVLDSGDMHDSEPLLTVEQARSEALEVYIASPDEVILGRSQVVDITVTNTSNINSYMDRISVVLPPTSDFVIGPHDAFFLFGDFEMGLDTSFVLMPQEHSGFARHLSYSLDRRPPGSQHRFRLTLPEIDYFNRTIAVLVDHSSMGTYFMEILRRANMLRSPEALSNQGLIPAEWQDFLNNDAAMLDSIAAWLEISGLMEVDVVFCDSLGLSPTPGCPGICYAAWLRDIQTGYTDTLTFQLPICDEDSEEAADIAYYNGDPCGLADIDGLDGINCAGGDGSDFGGIDGTSGGVTEDPTDESNVGVDGPDGTGGQNGGENSGGGDEGDGSNGRPRRQEFTCMWYDACDEIRREVEKKLLQVHKECREPSAFSILLDNGLGVSSIVLWKRKLWRFVVDSYQSFSSTDLFCDIGFFMVQSKIQSAYYKCSAVRSSCDPNILIGPEGVGQDHWVRVDSLASFSVHYENDSLLASSNANNVEIRLPINEEFDLSSFRIGSWNVGGTDYNAPGNQMALSNQFTHNGTLVNLTAGVDVQNREAYWLFESLDPQTLLPPSDPSAGYLPINNSQGSGEGYVTFSIRPSATAQTGDTLSAQAEIVFDINEPILTNIWTNLLDAEGPTSQVDSLVSVNDSTLVVHYSAMDPNNGSGMESVDVYVQQDGAWVLAAGQLHPDSSYRFTGTPGMEYCFATVARDTVQYVEALPSEPDQCMVLLPQAFAIVGPAAGSAWCAGDELVITWGMGGIPLFDIALSDEQGENFTLIASGVAGPSYTWPVPDGFIPGTGYRVRVIEAADPDNLVESAAFTVHAQPAQPVIAADGATSFCAGGQVGIEGPVGYTGYLWTPAATNASSITVQASGAYTLQVTDANGCTSAASLPVSITVWPLPPAPNVTPSPAGFCMGDSLLLSASGGYAAYSWSTGGTGQAIWVHVPGEVQVSGTDANGCTSPVQVVMVEQFTHPLNLQIIPGEADSLCSSVTTDSYVWYRDGAEIASGSPCIAMGWPGVYSLVAANGPCADTAVFIVTAIEDIDRSGNLRIVPNPSSGAFDLTMSGTVEGDITVTVLAADGKEVYRTRTHVGRKGRTLRIDLKGIATGVYQVRVFDGAMLRTLRAAVQF